jgi:hypothetical protein
MKDERRKWRLRAAVWRERAAACRAMKDREAYEFLAFEYELLADLSVDGSPDGTSPPTAHH